MPQVVLSRYRQVRPLIKRYFLIVSDRDKYVRRQTYYHCRHHLETSQKFVSSATGGDTNFLRKKAGNPGRSLTLCSFAAQGFIVLNG